MLLVRCYCSHGPVSPSLHDDVHHNDGMRPQSACSLCMLQYVLISTIPYVQGHQLTRKSCAARLATGAIIRAAREAAQANNPGAIVGAGAGAPSSSCSRPAPAATATVAEECEEERENSSPVCYMKL